MTLLSTSGGKKEMNIFWKECSDVRCAHLIFPQEMLQLYISYLMSRKMGHFGNCVENLTGENLINFVRFKFQSTKPPLVYFNFLLIS